MPAPPPPAHWVLEGIPFKFIASMMLVVMFLWLIVTLAVIVDFLFAVWRAKHLGIPRTSKRYRATIPKYLAYVAMLVIIGMIDMVVGLAVGGFKVFNVALPVVSMLATIVILSIEGKSVFETLGKNQQKDIEDSLRGLYGLTKTLSSEKKAEVLAQLADLIKDKDEIGQ